MRQKSTPWVIAGSSFVFLLCLPRSLVVVVGKAEIRFSFTGACNLNSMAGGKANDLIIIKSRWFLLRSLQQQKRSQRPTVINLTWLTCFSYFLPASPSARLLLIISSRALTRINPKPCKQLWSSVFAISDKWAYTLSLHRRHDEAALGG